MTSSWVAGNAISLLENGDEFFQRMFEVIETAEREILIETFILCDDPIGRKLKQALLDAVARGVWISVLVDGFGSYYLPRPYMDELSRAGVHFHVFDPEPRWLRLRVNIFRRLHRKIVVVDGLTAFIGGINLTHEHVAAYGREAKQDYAVELKGPVVPQIQRFAREAIQGYSQSDLQLVDLNQVNHPDVVAGDVSVLFLTRDNHRNPTSIETEYLERIRTAKYRITIANCYFFPGYRILKALRDAARRGVEVCLLTQGIPDSMLAKRANKTLYDFLVESDIRVYEYWERPLHGKIAAIDYDWSTVGSSNMDPLSFCLNLEANVFVRDREFNALVHSRIQYLIEHSQVRAIDQSWIRRRTLLKGFQSFLIYHMLRHIPGLTGWLPRLERKKAALAQARASQRDAGRGA